MSHWPLQRCTRLRGKYPIPNCTSEAHRRETTQCCWSWEKCEFSDSYYGFCDLGRFSVRYRATFGGRPRPFGVHPTRGASTYGRAALPTVDEALDRCQGQLNQIAKARH
jgi:hypothetical protein